MEVRELRATIIALFAVDEKVSVKSFLLHKYATTSNPPTLAVAQVEITSFDS